MSLVWAAVTPELATAFRGVSKALLDSDFYLAGGTGLALQVGHRRSLDLDLFSPTLTDAQGLADLLARRLPDLRVASVAPRTLYVTLGGAQVSFLGYAYPSLTPPIQLEPGLLPLAGARDLAAMKLSAIASRGSRKDFVDLWFLLRGGLDLPRALDAFRAKFASVDIGHVVRSLTYFEDAEQEPELAMLQPVSWQEVKADLRSRVESLLG